MILSGVCPTVSKIASSGLRKCSARLNSKIPGQIIYSYGLNSGAPAVKAAEKSISGFLGFLKKAGVDLSSGGGCVSLKNGNVINYIGRGKNLNVFMTKPNGISILEFINNGSTTKLNTKGMNLFKDSSILMKTVNKIV